MAYSYANLSDAQADLGRRLYDTTSQFWNNTEKTVYIQESLSTWNALTSFWRDSQTFTLSANNANVWYDLTTVAGSLRPMNTTDNAIMQSIEYTLLEPLTTTYPLTWTGSNQYTVADILDALTQRRDDLLGVSGCTLQRTLISAATNNTSTALGDTVIDIRRVAWLPTSANATYPNTPLRQSDDRELQDYQPGYLGANASVPGTWRISAQVPLTFSVDVLPAVSGNYETLVTYGGPVLSSAANNNIQIPNDWCWVLKFGALADLFSKEGLARDDLRAQYCEQRYQEGAMLLTDAPALLSAKVGNNTLEIDAVRNGDDFSPAWQNNASGVSNTIYTAGLNLIAFSPASSSNASVVCQVVENALLPVNSTDNIQLGRDDYAAVIDYAQHLAMLKVGGAEFQATIPLYQEFLQRAALYNSKLNALATAARKMYESSQWNAEREPVYSRGQGPQEILGGKQ